MVVFIYSCCNVLNFGLNLSLCEHDHARTNTTEYGLCTLEKTCISGDNVPMV